MSDVPFGMTQMELQQTTWRGPEGKQEGGLSLDFHVTNRCQNTLKDNFKMNYLLPAFPELLRNSRLC